MIRFTKLTIKDFCVIADAELPLDNQGLVLITAKNKDSAAADSNGSGKSTILHALGWCLYGKMIGESRPTDIVRRGARSAEVRVEWEKGDVQYELRRRATKTGQKLQLLTDGSPESGRTRADLESRVIDILGLDWDTMRNTVMYGQGDVARFASPNVTDSDRKSIMKRAMGLTQLDAALKHVRTQLRELKEESHEAQASAHAAARSVSRAKVTLTDAQEMAEGWQAEQERDANQLRFNINEAADKLVKVQKHLKKLPTWREMLVKLDEKLVGRTAAVQARSEAIEHKNACGDAFNDAKDAETEAIRAKVAAQAELNKAESSVNVIQNAIAVRKKEIKELDELGVCPVCHSDTSDSAGTQDHLTELQHGLDELEDDAAAAALASEEPRKALEHAEAQLQAAAGQKHAALTELTAAKRKQEAAIEAADQFERWLGDRQTIQERVDAAGHWEAKQTDLKAKLTSLKGDLKKLGENTNPHTAHVEAAQKSLDAAEADHDSAEADYTAAQEKMEPMRFWETAFSNRGLPSLALDAVMPIITESANEYLDILADGDIKVQLLPQRKLKAGGKKDEITILNHIEGHDDVRASGAQKAKISIAIDLALLDLIAAREGNSMDLLAIDECLDGLDAEGERRMFELLEYLATKRGTVLVVSHDGDIADRFTNVWTVVKEDGSSTVETD